MRIIANKCSHFGCGNIKERESENLGPYAWLNVQVFYNGVGDSPFFPADSELEETEMEFCSWDCFRNTVTAIDFNLRSDNNVDASLFSDISVEENEEAK